MSNDQWNQGQSGQWPSDQDGNWGAQPETQQSSNEWGAQQPQASANEWGQQPQASANEWGQQAQHSASEWNAGADQQAQNWNQQPQASASEWNAGQDQQAQAWDQQGQQNWDQQQPQASASEWHAGQPQQQGQAWDQQGQQNWNQAPGQYQQQQWQNPSQPGGGGLFSLDFTKFSLPQSGKLVWLIGIVVIAIVWLFDFISLLTSGTTLEIGGISTSAGEPKAMDIVRGLVSGLAMAALKIVLLRVAIEGVIALVKIAENGKSDD
ncbi:DUF4282 domain-containing protein [uncultured Tessaracoccus sp.]|uniref:DUF4282 domain-containing protein n=1 Tax=uncultured Tessaracoccus sp. TaxID=905023 RepID=UPI0026094DDA|nr:DUF4282 domain-containing protein [uncultured Tessaracoccus sp.]